MRAFIAVSTSLIASLVLAVSVAARPTGQHQAYEQAVVRLPWSGLSVGVNDDSGYSRPDWVYPTMSNDGLKLNTLTLRWDAKKPFTIPAKEAVRNAIAAAQVNGISIALNLYPLHARALTGGKKCKPSQGPEACGNRARIAEFAGWTGQVARAFPSVHQFVVMNECNQPRFLNPQWDASDQNQSAAICGRALAGAYDALKAVGRSNFVWGIGLSPRGNDNPRARSNPSTSPVRFIGYLGAWFKEFAKKTHRTAPLMDGLDFHPYPVPQSLPFATGYAKPNNASVTNLPRLYQAFYDGFDGSPQRTIGQQTGGGLPVSLNETGIQTASRGNEYDGSEVSATPAGGVLGQWATQTYQAKWYLGMLKVAACDPNVRVVNFFHLLDETNLTGWQSGLYFANQTPKRSAWAVRDWITSTGANCHATSTPWKPGSKATINTIDLSKLKLPKPPKIKPVRPPTAPQIAVASRPVVNARPAEPPVPAPAGPVQAVAPPELVDVSPPAGSAPPADPTPPGGMPPGNVPPPAVPPSPAG